MSAKPQTRPVARAQTIARRQLAANAAPELPKVPLSEYLAAKEIGAEFGVDADSIYRWRSEGRIPESFVHYCGPSRLLFHPHVVAYLRDLFRELH